MELSVKRVFGGVALAALAVFSHWGVWQQGVYSVGWNSSLVWIIFGAWLVSESRTISFKIDCGWIMPLFLIVLSFGLYDSPWLKTFSIFLTPVIFGFSFAFSQFENRHTYFFSLEFTRLLFRHAHGPIRQINQTYTQIKKVLASLLKPHPSQLGSRVIRGLLILLPLATLIIVLLSSADSKFDLLAQKWFGELLNIFELSFVAKILWVAALTVVMLAATLSYSETSQFELTSSNSNVDGVVAGIVMVGVLVIYIVFICLQLEHLIVEELPIEFSKTEALVKSGFWQLFSLSVINVILFFTIYKNTNSFTQWILRFYLLASILILASACWRITLYVYYYGLSYEKFFAAYTTLFAVIVFGYLIACVMSAERKDIIKRIFVLFLWGYAIATLLPIDKIIVNSNLALAKQSNSRIDLYHLTALSADSLRSLEQGIADSSLNSSQWKTLVEDKKHSSCTRKWFERNLSLVIACDAWGEAKIINLPDKLQTDSRTSLRR